MTQKVTIPLPPTTNHLFRNISRGRVRSQEYNAWIEKALWFCKMAVPKLKPVTEYPVTVHLRIYGENGFPVSCDVANREKAATDLLVKAGVLKDDTRKYIRKSIQEWVPLNDRKAPAYAEIEVYPYVD